MIASNLGVPSDFLCNAFEPDHTSFVRINYYPVCVGNGGHTPYGVNEHTDAGALTVLLQDQQSGLEVFRNGDWKPVAPTENALLVNIGDVVQVLVQRPLPFGTSSCGD